MLDTKLCVSPGVILGHVKALENDTAKYPLNRVLYKVYSVPQGSMSFVQDNIFVGQMPKRIIVEKEMRDILLNAHYLFLFKNPRDQSQIIHLGRQLYPSQTKFFREVYEDATSKPFSYLLIDLNPDTDDSLRLRSGILPGDKYCVYQPR
ncbi:uncharacterized protein CDAR_311301 [Caerostris darwini]|uniref:Uncharacterized protein n=1 Tax=Caerostris darwini TaxID=1538125 RepID=A0AAV4USY7_9ARAC|nr:uncharacterized protein CDAR_311301 [Caerostris darwini]